MIRINSLYQRTHADPSSADFDDVVALNVYKSELQATYKRWAWIFATIYGLTCWLPEVLLQVIWGVRIHLIFYGMTVVLFSSLILAGIHWRRIHQFKKTLQK